MHWSVYTFEFPGNTCNHKNMWINRQTLQFMLLLIHVLTSTWYVYKCYANAAAKHMHSTGATETSTVEFR